MNMIINTFSYLWSATAAEAIAELCENGYDTFEVPISSPHCWPDEMSVSKRSESFEDLKQRGAKIRSLNAGGYDINLASPGANMRRKSIDHITSVIELAEVWEASEVVISPGTRRPMISPPLESVHGWLYESLNDLIPIAKQAGVRLLFENTPYCFAPTIQDLTGIVHTVNDDSLKIVYDVANAAYIREDPLASLLSHHESIALMHISDTGLDTWGHDPLGTGVIDWNGLGEAVEATLGSENVVLEIIREKNPRDEFDAAMRYLKSRGWNVDAGTHPPKVGRHT